MLLGHGIYDEGLTGLTATVDFYKRPFVVTASRRIGIITLSTDVRVKKVLACIITPSTIPIIILNNLAKIWVGESTKRKYG